ncbi:MAG: signal peptidase I [Candidatus Omnitrophota bacterium]
MAVTKRFFAFILVLLLSTGVCSGENLLPIKRFVIPQNGMYPSLPAKSTFWVINRPYLKLDTIARGDIVVFSQERDGETYDFVWRVIGLPGDHIVLKGISITINGNELSRTANEETPTSIIYKENLNGVEYHVAYSKNPPSERRIDLDLNVPQDQLFLMGDNRDQAWDSRFTGLIPIDRILGRKINRAVTSGERRGGDSGI